MADWPELDALAQEIREQNDARWQQTDTLRRHFQELRGQHGLAADQFASLKVQELLEVINEQVLAGLGTVEVVQSGAGMEVLAALAWPAFCDPRVSEESSDAGVYRIEVWLGLDPQSSRLRIRLAGEKRLEATLPTSEERFRAALLQVFRSPRFLSHGPAEGEQAESEEINEEQAESGPATPGPEEPSHQAPEAAEASQEPGEETVRAADNADVSTGEEPAPSEAEGPIRMGPRSEPEP